MPPKKKPNEPSKKVETKKKEKIIEVCDKSGTNLKKNNFFSTYFFFFLYI